MRDDVSTTPASWEMFAAHRDQPFAFFLDRGIDPRPSFAGSRPHEQLVVDATGRVRVFHAGQWTVEHDDPVEAVSRFVDRSCRRPLSAPAWLEGVCLPRTVGYLAYELGRWTEPQRTRAQPPDRVGTPLAVLSTYDEVDAWDPRTGSTARIRFCAEPPASGPEALTVLDSSAWTPTTRESYARAFAIVREAIAAGDIYQANLSRRCVFDADADPPAMYRRLRDLQPVPWGGFLDFGGFALLSNSPECFLLRSGDRVLTRPIKGTRPRPDDGSDLDEQVRAELRNDAKEMAEHLMIVDLERNDLGRVARTGSVRVARFAGVDSFSTLHHIVSEVEAVLREGVDLAALLRATFPGGSITGAPKIRAMEILSEVEDSGRGPYTGAIGCFNGSNEMELSIAIRTAVASGGRLLYSSGGGIVADSDFGREWEETETKTSALRQALDANSPGRACSAQTMEATG